jgi:ubiquitin-protein ligase E3 C
MPGFLDPSFDNERYNDINLSTSTSTSSTALLNSVRQQRQAREQRRKEDNAAILIQTRWRGFSQRKQTIERILLELENGQGGNWQATGRKLVLLAKAGNAVDLADRRRKLLVQWCEQGKAADPSEYTSSVSAAQ